MRISDWSSDVCSSDLQGMAPSETEAANAQEIDLGLSLSFVSAGFPLSGAGGEDTDGSEAITSVTVTIDAGTLELGAGAPAGSSLIDNGDRKSVVSGKSVSVRVDLGGGGVLKKNKQSGDKRGRRR